MEDRTGALLPLGRSRLLGVLLCVLALLLVPKIARAGVWASESPYGTVRLEPTVVSADYFGTTVDPRSPSIVINGKTYKAYVQNIAGGHWASKETLVDGIWVVTWTWVSNPVETTNTRVYCYVSAPPDGSYDVTMSVKDTTGVISRDRWSFAVEAPPTFGAQQPAVTSVITTTNPIVSISVRDNTAVTSYSALFNSIPASATFDGAKVTVTNFAVVDGTNAVTVTAADARGNSSTKTWSFKAKLPGCGCHGSAYASAPIMGPDCESCHSGGFAPPHASYPPGFVHTTPSTASLCSSCHRAEITDEHALHNVSCMDCHQSSNSSVRIAIASGSSECNGCHSSFDHYDSVNHTATPAPAVIRISGVDFGPYACSQCHGLSLRDSHQASNGTAQCLSCHPQPRNSLATWSGGCAEGNCHTFSSARPMHDSVDASHAIPEQRAVGCIDSGCHDLSAMTVFQGKSIAAIHSSATTTTASGVRSSCQVCHAPGVVPAADCLTSGCHPERAEGHGFDASKHVATDGMMAAGTVLSPAAAGSDERLYYTKDYTYTGQACSMCHSLQVTEEHSKSSSSSSASGCAACHPTARATFQTWNKSCSQGGCHPAVPATQHATSMTVRHAATAKTTVPGDPVVASDCGNPTCHKTDLVIEHTRRVIINPIGSKPKPSEYVVTGGPLTCEGCHKSGAFASLNGSWDGSCISCHPDSHAVAGTARALALPPKHLSYCAEHDTWHDAVDMHKNRKGCTTTGGCHTAANVYPGYPFGSRGFGSVTDPAVGMSPDCNTSTCHGSMGPPAH